MNETRYAGVAQLVEQLICNQQVGGSSPSTSSTISKREYGRFPEWPKGADCKSVVNDFGGSNPPPPTKRQSIERCSVFLLLSRFRMGEMDSKAGSWQHAGCMLQPAWLFCRKANPPPPTKEESTSMCSLLFYAQKLEPSLSLRDISPKGRDRFGRCVRASSSR